MSDQKKHWAMFDRDWFEKHQKAILFFLNNTFTKRIARWMMRIRPFDCPLDTRINAIWPNSFVYNAKQVGDKWELTQDFRTHRKFSKRMYYSLKPLWWAMHIWDELVADRWVPRLSFGFDTLTQYTESNGTNDPVDGYYELNLVDVTWATLKAATDATSTTNSDNVDVAYLRGGTTTDYYARLRRGITLFDTSALTSSAAISSAVHSLYGRLKFDNLSATPNYNIYAVAPASDTSLDTGDWDTFGTTAYADTAISYASFNNAGYNDITMNSTGISAISKTGTTKIGAYNANYDVANTAPPYVSGQVSSLSCEGAEETGTTKDPKLVVTYTLVTFRPVAIVIS